MEDGKTVAKPETDPAKNGYDFGGWQNGEAEYDFSAAVKSDLALTAKWTAHAYTITYELNGGTNSSDNPDKYTIESEDITLKDPTGPAAAPVFQGWYSDKDFQNRVSPAVIAKGSTGDRTFYARFGTEALKEFTVTFNVVAEAGGAVLGSDSVKVNDGDKISDAQLEAAKGKIASLGEYEYDGLYTDAALATAFDTSAKISADTTLYVKVKAVQKFTVTFDSDGGSAVAAVTVKSGEKAAKPADPAKDGYTFKCWLLGDAEYSFDAPVTGDITLKAKWEANKTEPEPTPVEPTVATSMTAVKIEEGTFSLPDGTYQTKLDGSNPILIVTMPEAVSMKGGDSVKLTGTVTFDDKTVYKQFYLQADDKSGTPIFGWNMVAEWSDTGLKELKKDLSVTQKIESDYSFDSCKFVFSGPLTEGDTTCPTFTLKDVKVTYIPYVPGAETRVALYEGEGFKAYTDNFDASKLKEYLDSSTGGAKLVFTYKLGNYTPKYDYDEIGVLTGWDTSGKEWVNSTDDFKNYGFNIPCPIAGYADKVGTEQTKEFDVETLLSNLKNTHKFTINIYADNDQPPKAVFTKIEVVYTAK